MDTTETTPTPDWKEYAVPNPDGYYDLVSPDLGDVPVRLFFTPELLEAAEEGLYKQIVNATQFPGVKLVVITPDAHYGYGVPVGSVILTDGTLAMGPVGYDIGCFTGDTLVPTADGYTYSLEELTARGGEIMVYALDADKRVIVASATARLTRRAAMLMRVTLDNGAHVVCTPDHRFMLRNGVYRMAQELRKGISLMPFDGAAVESGSPAKASTYNHQVISTEMLSYREDVYCLTVPDYGNFALDAGVFVHNCGMVSARSDVPAEAATPDMRLRFNRAVMRRIEMGAGGKSRALQTLSEPEFMELVRGGADAYITKYDADLDRSRAERNRIPVDEDWTPPWGGKGKPERGIRQLGSLGGGKVVASHLQ